MGSLRFLAAALVVVAAAALGGLAAGRAPAAAPPGLDRLVGARLVVGIDGTTATPSLLERIRARPGRRRDPDGPQRAFRAAGARADGVVRAAAQAAADRFLIMTDQEGGAVRRFRWAPPAAPAEELGRLAEARAPASAAAPPRRRSSGSASTSTSRRSPTCRPPRARSSRGSNAASRRSRRASPRT